MQKTSRFTKKLHVESLPTPPEGSHIFSWGELLYSTGHRISIPENYPLIGMLPVHKLVERTKLVEDHMLAILGSLPKKIQTNYRAPIWTRKAYTKMFEKFDYHPPLQDIKLRYPKEWNFATYATINEYKYMDGTRITPFEATTKNSDSTPGYPKFDFFKTEQDYLDAHGLQEYYEVWDLIKEPKFSKRPLWWTFLKVEPVKQEKLKNEDFRMIMCTDPVYTRIGARFEQHQNDLMKEHTTTNEGQVGWTPFKGGLHFTLKRLEKHPYIVETDWTRFDGTIPSELLRHIKTIRYFFLHPQYRTTDNYRRYKWYVDSLIDKYVLLPTGEVTIITKGNPSGQISTTTDNIMVNTFLTAFEWAYWQNKLGNDITCKGDPYGRYQKDVTMICYGDDRLMSVEDKPDPAHIIEMYKNVFGMWIKPDNFKITTSLEGTSFCGFTFRKVNGFWRGSVNVEKLLSTLVYPVKQLPDINALWTKLISLRLLTEYSDDDVKILLERAIYNVECAMRADGVEPPLLPVNFFTNLW